MADYRNPQWLLPNCKNLKLPEAGATTGSGLTEDRHSLYSMDFDGTAYIDAGNPTELQFTGAFSVSFWMKSDATGNRAMVSKDNNASNPRAFSIERTNAYPGGYFVVYNGTTAYGVYVASSDTNYVNLNDNNWHNVVAVYTPSTSVALFVDGNFIKSNTTSIPASVNFVNDNLNIGRRSQGINYFAGKIDEVAIFNTALTASEVQALSTASAPANIMALSKKPIAYYPLGEQARDNTEWQFPNEVLQSHVFDFDGTDYIDISPILPLQGVSSFSISTWVYWDGHGGGSDQWVFMHANAGNTKRIQLEIYNNDLIFKLTGTGGGNATIDMPQGRWVSLLCVFNSSEAAADRMIVYIDGQRATNVAYSAPTMTTTATDYSYSMIGARNDGYYFDGKLSNVAIWNSDQSANIANIYNYGAPQTSYTVTPTAWYKLNATNTYAGLNPNWHSALDFSGSSQYVDITQSLSNTSGALSFWINPDTISGTQAFFGHGNTTTTVDFFSVSTYTSGKLRILFRNDSSGTAWPTNGADLRTDASVITTNKWYHVLLVSNGTSYTMYLNGESIALNVDAGSNSGKWFGDISGVTMNKTYIGALNNSSGVVSEFNGQVANVAIFNQAISAEDVLYLYNGGTPQTNISFEPTSWYKLDNLTTGIQDSGSASNNGTNNGATAVSSSVAVNQWNFYNVPQSQTPNYSSALNFANNAKVSAGSITSLNNVSNASYSFWFYPTSSSGSIGFIGGQSAAITAYFFSNVFYIHNLGTGYISTSIPTLNQWHHVCCTFDAGSTEAFLNGISVGTNTNGSATTNPNGANDFEIGRANNYNFYFNSGQVSNVALFNSSLTNTQVQTLYNNGSPEAAISHSPVAWWKLDSTTITDSSGNGNTGTNSGATEIQTNVWTPRLNGESTTLPSTALVSSDLQFESPYSNFSLNFDGATNYIFANTSVLSGLSTASISMWLNVDSISATRGILSLSDGAVNDEITLSTFNSRLYVRIRNASTNFKYSSDWASQSANTWIHLCLVYDGNEVEANRIKVYLNNSLINFGSGTGSTPVTLPTFTQLTIGNDIDGSNFEGKIDELSIFNKALNQAEISQIYNNGYAADLTSLSPVSWWRLGEDAYFVGNNITVPNQISGAPNGTGAGTQTSILVADAPGSYGSGVGTNLAVEDRKGDAPESTANSLSFNMIPTNRIHTVPNHTKYQVDNVYSMAFNYVDLDYINIGNISSLNATTNFSLSMWVKPGGGGGANKEIFTIANSTSESIVINHFSNDLIYGVGTTTQFNRVSSGLSAGVWAHLCFVFNGSESQPADKFKLYKDSVYVTPTIATGVTATSTPTFTGNAFIGAWALDQSDFTFDGNIDEFAIFDYSLSKSQIYDIYTSTTTGKTANLNGNSNIKAPVAWYRMGD